MFLRSVTRRNDVRQSETKSSQIYLIDIFVNDGKITPDGPDASRSFRGRKVSTVSVSDPGLKLHWLRAPTMIRPIRYWRSRQDMPASSHWNYNFITFFKGNNVTARVIQGDGTGGVTQASCSADYTEYMPRLENDENISPADIVGVVDGRSRGEP